MEKYLLLTLIICVVLLFGFTSLSLAQGPAEERESEEEAAEEMSDDVKGYVVAIDAPSRSIAVREDESGEIYQMSIKGNATIYGASSLSEISVGDMLNIDYYTFNDHMIATNINVEEKTDKEETAAVLEKVLSD